MTTTTPRSPGCRGRGTREGWRTRSSTWWGRTIIPSIADPVPSSCSRGTTACSSTREFGALGYDASAMAWLVPLESLAKKRADPRQVGGKAAGLAWLIKNEFAVPEGWVIGHDAFEAAIRELSPACEPRSLLRAAGGRSGYARAAEARQEILNAQLPRGLE